MVLGGVHVGTKACNASSFIQQICVIIFSPALQSGLFGYHINLSFLRLLHKRCQGIPMQLLAFLNFHKRLWIY